MSAANACTDKQPTAHRQSAERNRDAGCAHRPAHLSADRQRPVSPFCQCAFCLDPRRTARPQAFCRFCQSLPGGLRRSPPRWKLPRADTERKPGRRHTQRLGQLFERIHPGLSALFDLGNGAGVQLSRAGQPPIRVWLRSARAVRSRSAMPSHEAGASALSRSAKSEGQPSSRQRERRSKAERWFLPSVSAGQSRRRERLPQKRNLALPEPCA